MFVDDLAFLQQYTQVKRLSDAQGRAQLIVCPQMQGRVMTSTATGPEGLSYGWINREFIASGQNNPHINAFGGEDRLWLGPEGGQFSIFFKAGDPFDLEHWYTPAPINEEAFEVVSEEPGCIRFRKSMKLINYSGTVFELEIDRKVRLLPPDVIAQRLSPAPATGLDVVAYESENRITNTGAHAWVRESGLLSIWILGMFNPSPSTTVVIPYRHGPESELGPVVNDAYFGVVPAGRLVIGEKVIFFSGDGLYRSKIGLDSRRCLPVLGSYDAGNHVLTLVQYSKPEGEAEYVNSMWKIQDDPYSGDVVNSYNDGPPAPGQAPMGPFYELETSSPAAALAPGETLSHLHTTFHLQGDEESLDPVAHQLLGARLDEIANAFAQEGR